MLMITNRRSSRSRRLITWASLLALLAGIGLLVGLLSPVARSFTSSLFWRNDPEYARQVGQQMAEYTLPAGFEERRALEMQGVRSVMIAPPATDAESLIVLTDGIPGLGDPDYRDTVEAGWARNVGERRYETRLVETRSMIIRGGPARLSVREGTDDRGAPIRQLTMIFGGKEGPVLLVVVGRPDSWEQILLDEFINSLR